MIDESQATTNGDLLPAPSPDQSAEQSPSPATTSRRGKLRPRKSYATADLATALTRRYPSDRGGAFGVLFEVGNSTGFACNRHADALVMSLWPSRGIWLAGFEFKASRGDWLKEYADPHKSEPIQRYCDYWWLAVTDASIVKDGELPETWGLMALNGRGTLEVIKDAPKLSPVTMDRAMLAAIFRQVAEPIANMGRREVIEAEGRVRSQLLSERARALASEKEKYNALLASIRDFEHASGIPVLNNFRMRYGSHSPESLRAVGNAIRFLLSGADFSSQSSSIKHAAQTLDNTQRDLSELAESLLAIDSIRQHLEQFTKQPDQASPATSPPFA